MRAIDKVRVTPRNVYTVTTPKGEDIDTVYAGEIPADRSEAIKLMTRYVMAAKDPVTMYDPYLVAATEAERARAEALESSRKAEDPGYIGVHTEARNDAVNWLLRMQPELFELEVTEQAATSLDSDGGIVIPFQSRQPIDNSVGQAAAGTELAMSLDPGCDMATSMA